MKPDPKRLELSAYPHRIDVTTRFADIDPQRHLNNVRIAEFYQEVRMSFQAALRTEFRFERGPDSRILVAHQSIDYLDEAAYPGTLTIGAGIARLGSTSFTLGMGMFQNGKCVGVSDAVLVHATKSGPTPLLAREREALATKLLPNAAM